MERLNMMMGKGFWGGAAAIAHFNSCCRDRGTHAAQLGKAKESVLLGRLDYSMTPCHSIRRGLQGSLIAEDIWMKGRLMVGQAICGFPEYSVCYFSCASHVSPHQVRAPSGGPAAGPKSRPGARPEVLLAASVLAGACASH